MQRLTNKILPVVGTYICLPFSYSAVYRLQGYVVKEHGVKSLAECAHHCFQTHPVCKFFNYESGKEIPADQERKCQLNNDTKSSYLSLSAAENFDYWEIQPEMKDFKVSLQWLVCH